MTPPASLWAYREACELLPDDYLESSWALEKARQRVAKALEERHYGFNPETQEPRYMAGGQQEEA